MEKRIAIILPMEGHEDLVASILRSIRIGLTCGNKYLVIGRSCHRICTGDVEWYAYNEKLEPRLRVGEALASKLLDALDDIRIIVNGAGSRTAQTLTLPALNRNGVPVHSLARFGPREFKVGYLRWFRFVRRERPVPHTLVLTRRFQRLVYAPHTIVDRRRLSKDMCRLVEQRL